jgi:hypothetical protein
MKSRPKSKYFRKFGFELEFSTPIKKTKKIIKKIITKTYKRNMLDIEESYGSGAREYKKWELKLDGSTECELTTPISTIHNFKTITKILNELSQNKLEITNRDSVHVHMQANDVPKHNIIAAWILLEKVIMSCFPHHRRDNTYCQKLINKRYKKISDFFIDAEQESDDHHAILSLNYYSQRKTVEFRIMEGNLDPNDILPWVKFCMLFLNYAKNIDPIEIICNNKPKININDIIDLLNIRDREVSDFLIRRQKTFKKHCL